MVVRIQFIISFNKSVTKNIRSESFKCEIVKTLHLALPLLSKSILPICNFSPCSHCENDALAISAFIFMAKFMRLSLGKNEFTSKTPIFSNGGFAICVMSSAILTPFEFLKFVKKIVWISKLSGEFISSVFSPTSDITALVIDKI